MFNTQQRLYQNNKICMLNYSIKISVKCIQNFNRFQRISLQKKACKLFCKNILLNLLKLQTKLGHFSLKWKLIECTASKNKIR